MKCLTGALGKEGRWWSALLLGGEMRNSMTALDLRRKGRALDDTGKDCLIDWRREGFYAARYC
jgi:hypothetical protein